MSSIDSNSGGDTRRPVIATRTGANANLGLMPRPSTSADRSATSRDAASQPGRSTSAAVEAASTAAASGRSAATLSGSCASASSATNRNPSRSRAWPSSVILSCTSGVAASISCCSRGVGGSATSPDRYGSSRWARSTVGRARMCWALIASALATSKRAGLALTSATSKAATISARVNTSRSSAMPQPSRAR